MSNPIRVLIADDQSLFSESLKFVLEGESKGRISVCGIVENGREAVDFVQKVDIDIILMDIRMPVLDGVEATASIHRSNKDVKIIILTTFDDDELAVSALSGGASGYVLKNVKPKDLIRCIEAVQDGAYYISPSVGIKMFDMMKSSEQEYVDDMEHMVLGYVKLLPKVSRRECEILYHIAHAKTNKEIADALYISEKTVRNHLSSVFAKLRIHNRLQLMHKILTLSERIRNGAHAGE